MIPIISRVAELIHGTTSNNDGSLGGFVVTTDNVPHDSVKAAALQYHDFDINGSHHLLKSLIRRKGIKSKFAKKNDADENEGDSDVDEATREESPPNDTKHQRVTNAHLAKMAQTNTDLSNLRNFRG